MAGHAAGNRAGTFRRLVPYLLRPPLSPIDARQYRLTTMKKLSVCVLTFNSERLLEACIEPLTRIADELIVVDSGSSDGTLAILEKFGLTPLYRP
ncbi:MAG: glycosyltransferase, partial [Microvirgula sp.]